MKCFVFVVSLLLALHPLLASEKVIVDKQGMDCHVYLPEKIDQSIRYQLVVGVHGAGGKCKGAARLAKWADRGDVIVIGPSFVSKVVDGVWPYQMGNGIHAEKLIELFEQLKKEYPLKDKMFLHGFSGGSQFVHRFTMNHPDVVCGVSAHSGGSWATDGYGKINSRAKGIPFAISCGEKDTKKSTKSSPYGRLEWCERFRVEIDKIGFVYIADTWPDVAHRISPGAVQLMRECFQIATGLPGGEGGDLVEISPEWKKLPADLDRVKR